MLTRCDEVMNPHRAAPRRPLKPLRHNALMKPMVCHARGGAAMDALRACLPEDLLKAEAEKEQGAEKKRKMRQWDDNGEATVSRGTSAPNTESITLTFPHPGEGNWRQQEPNRCAHTQWAKRRDWRDDTGQTPACAGVDWLQGQVGQDPNCPVTAELGLHAALPHLLSLACLLL